jgi:hypothetical protein
MEDTMDFVVTVVRPIILRIATHPSVKNLVISLLEKYVSSTDNSIDNEILKVVKELIFKPQTNA